MSNSIKTYDYCVFIGRFQPFHKMHKKVIDRALEIAEKVVVLIGSADSGRTLRNPFTFDERKAMILGAYTVPSFVDGEDVPSKRASRILVEPLPDIAYNDQTWVAQVQKIIEGIVVRDMNEAHPNVTIRGHADARVTLIGHSKDHSSYYLKLFPQWDSINVPQHELLSATTIRDLYFQSDMIANKDIPLSVFTFLSEFRQTPEYKSLCDEHAFIKSYKEAWVGAPYEPVFVTTDAVVIQSGHILLVRRKNHPGKGLLALPGGFVNQHETLEKGVVRELLEETAIRDGNGKLHHDRLAGFIQKTKVFDFPMRDPRGRVLTHAYLFKLPGAKKLYKVKGGDDAETAQWHPLGTLKRSDLFADHYDIIQEMVQEI